jgi:hypothetical protein
MRKTSEEWNKLYNITILDPDGWDRKNFYYSWYEEKITKDEFKRRVLESTIKGIVNRDQYLFRGMD